MKRILALISAVLLCLMCGCSKEDTTSGAVGLDKSSIEIAVGESCKLKLHGANEPEWSSADQDIARVFYGAVTGVSVGETTVTAVSDGKSYSCAVKVVEGDKKVEPESQVTDSSQKTETQSKDKTEKKPTSSSQKTESSKKDESKDTEDAADEFMKERIHKQIDEEYDKAIAEFSAECDELIWEMELNVESTKRDIESMNKEKPDMGDLVYGEKLKELEAEVERLKKVKADGIATYNRRRAEDKENWRDRVATIEND